MAVKALLHYALTLFRFIPEIGVPDFGFELY